MRLPLLLLVFAALFIWATVALEQRSVAGEVVAAQRNARADAPQTARPLETRAAAPAEIAGGPSLFRPAQTPAEEGPVVGERFELVGLTGSESLRIALLRDAADRQSFRVREGDSVRDWRVNDITERCAELVRGRRRQSVCLS